MTSFVDTVEKAYSDYHSGYEMNVIPLLKNAFDRLFEVEKIQLEEVLFNALYDALELTEIIVQSAVFEKNDFLKNALLLFKNELDNFLQPQKGSVSELTSQIYTFSEVLNGLSVATMYLKRRKLKLTDFPPEVSFELTESGFIKLYLWTEEGNDKIADVQSLREEFDLLFEKEQKTVEDLLNQVDAFSELKDFESALKVLNQLHDVQEDRRSICFLKKAALFLKMKRYEDAVDALLKSSVLGINKNEISEKLKFAVQQLIQNATSHEEKKKWTEFLMEYCP